ncbi:MAG: MFS transporter [Myxococcales bacterium]|nr:MFS transporter [Myxococcales bacterium]
MSTAAPAHADAFRRRRFMNWFPLGVSYALLYMGRYNLTVAKTNLGQLMTKEDFGLIFAAGTVVYALAFLVNGPLVDRVGGRRGMLIGLAGSFVANVAMGAYLHHVLRSADPTAAPLRAVFSVLYAVNMYFQSYGAVSIVKVNAHWFHVTERGGFSGIFGTMIASGIFLAFTVNGWLLDLAETHFPGSGTAERAWVVFAVPGALLGLAWVAELLLLRDRPSQAGHADFDTGDASSGDDDAPVPTALLFRRILTNPVILTVALIEFCTGVVRNGVMHWFPIYASEIWVLPRTHVLRLGQWEHLGVVVACFAAAAVSGVLAARADGRRRGALAVFSGLAFLAPFFQAGWGGLLMIAGVLGGNVAGWVSDLLFQSRRGPAAAGMYALLCGLTLGMTLTLAVPGTTVASAGPASGLVAGDQVLAIAGRDELGTWSDVRAAVACFEPVCRDSRWDPERCECRSAPAGRVAPIDAESPLPHRAIPARVLRDGATLELQLTDPRPEHRAGDLRLLDARPELPLSPLWLGTLVFLMSLCVIGTHGLLSGTATMDFGGRKGAATAVGVIDGFVYLGTALQSVCLGYLTSNSWTYWPWFLLPFALIGFGLCLRIWHAKPGRAAAH